MKINKCCLHCGEPYEPCGLAAKEKCNGAIKILQHRYHHRDFPAKCEGSECDIPRLEYVNQLRADLTKTTERAAIEYAPDEIDIKEDIAGLMDKICSSKKIERDLPRVETAEIQKLHIELEEMKRRKIGYLSELADYASTATKLRDQIGKLKKNRSSIKKSIAALGPKEKR